MWLASLRKLAMRRTAFSCILYGLKSRGSVVKHLKQDTFVRKFSATTTDEKEMELLVDFEFLTKEEMAEDYHMSQNLGS